MSETPPAHPDPGPSAAPGPSTVDAIAPGWPETARIDRDFARNVDWNLLKVFLEIVRAEGIGAAARNLNKQQPSVSAALKRLEDLRRERFVLTGADEPESVTRLRSRHGLGSERAGLAEDIHEALRLITLGVGIGFLPTGAAEAAVAAGKLWPLLAPELQPSYEIFLISRADPSRDTATQLFLDEIRRRLRARTP